MKCRRGQNPQQRRYAGKWDFDSTIFSLVLLTAGQGLPFRKSQYISKINKEERNLPPPKVINWTQYEPVTKIQHGNSFQLH